MLHMLMFQKRKKLLADDKGDISTFIRYNDVSKGYRL